MCSDKTGDNLDLCNGFNEGQEDVNFNEDCNPDTPDGFDEGWLNSACDTPANDTNVAGNSGDLDQCKEGQWKCHNGEQKCTDDTGNNLEICNGQDDDCDGQINDDAADDPNVQAQVACDGNTMKANCPAGYNCVNTNDDSDHCKEGAIACAGGSLACVDPSGDNLDLCDGNTNDDCNTITKDGDNEPAAAGVAHGCSATSNSGNANGNLNITATGNAGKQTLTGTIGNTGIHNWYTVKFNKPGVGTAFNPRIKFTTNVGNKYKFDVYKSCNLTQKASCAGAGENSVGRTHWEMKYTYKAQGASGNDKKDNTGFNATYYLKVYRQVNITGTNPCSGYSIEVRK
jgi:hypothetical protein